jgi:hypothetical protein
MSRLIAIPAEITTLSCRKTVVFKLDDGGGAAFLEEYAVLRNRVIYNRDHETE